MGKNLLISTYFYTIDNEMSNQIVMHRSEVQTNKWSEQEGASRGPGELRGRREAGRRPGEPAAGKAPGKGESSGVRGRRKQPGSGGACAEESCKRTEPWLRWITGAWASALALSQNGPAPQRQIVDEITN